MATYEAVFDDGRIFQFEMDDDATEAQIRGRIEGIRTAEDPANYPDPTAQYTPAQRGLATIGRGFANVARQIGNIAGAVPDETLQDYERLDAPLLSAPGATAANLVGEVGALGGPLGAATTGAARLGARVAPRIAAAMSRNPVKTATGVGMLEGAAEGGVLAGPERRFMGMAGGALAGGGAGGLLRGAQRGVIETSPSARILEDEMGIESLTPGLKDPAGAWNQMELMASSVPIGVGAARQTAMGDFAEAMVRAGQPPGAPPIRQGDLSDMLEQVYQQFEPAYAQFKNFPVDNQMLSRLDNDFANVRNITTEVVPSPDRETVGNYLYNQVEALRGKGNLTSGDLIQVRSNIRKQIHKLGKNNFGDNAGKVTLLREAEKAMTTAIGDVVPPDTWARIGPIDEAYSKHKIAEEAIYRARDRGDPTQFQWSEAIRNASPSRRAYLQKTGPAGEMRRFSQAGAEVFEEVSPKTGQRLVPMAAMAALGALGGGIGGPAGALASLLPGAISATGVGRDLVAGQTAVQQMMRAATGEGFRESLIRQLAPAMYGGAINRTPESELPEYSPYQPR